MNNSLTVKVCFLGTGLFVVAAVAVGLHPVSSPSVAADVPAAAVDAVSGPRSITLNGPGDVGVVSMAYEAGQSSGWHSHAGIHAVAVLSGTLTVYDAQCRPQYVVPGQPYVGGQELHLARNETQAPVEMIVTYINPSATAGADSRHAAPPACDRVTGDARGA